MKLPKKVREKKFYVVVPRDKDFPDNQIAIWCDTREDARNNCFPDEVIYQAKLYNFKKVR